MNDNSSLYEAFKSKDARFDGHFFVGVSSTGIYCRPVCKAKLPKEDNCTYYKSAAQAEQAGYRPCLLCRPELAPSNDCIDYNSALAYQMAKVLDECCSNNQKISEVASYLGYTDRHLRRIFVLEYNVTPVKYLQTCRLLLAKNLLTDTNLSILDVAMTSGFGSLRRFNDVFKKHYRLTPTNFRKQGETQNIKSNQIELALGYRPPYNWTQMLKFLADNALVGIEKVVDSEYYRTLRIETDSEEFIGWIKVSNNSTKNLLNVSVDLRLLPVLPNVLAKVRQLFDLSCNPQLIYDKLKVMNKFENNLCVLGTRVPGCIDSFELSIRAILKDKFDIENELNIINKLIKKYGTKIETNIIDLEYLFPLPKEIIAREISELETIVSKDIALLIYDMAKFYEADETIFMYAVDPQLEMSKIIEKTKISEWSAKYIALRSMHWTDVSFSEDFKKLGDYKKNHLVQILNDFSPWQSYATINLWNFLADKQEEKQ